MKNRPVFYRPLFCAAFILFGMMAINGCGSDGSESSETKTQETTIAVTASYPYRMIPITSGLTIEGSLYANDSMLETEKIAGPVGASSANSENTSFEFVFSDVSDGSYFLNVSFKGDAASVSASSNPATATSGKQVLKTTEQEQCEQDKWAASEQNCAGFEDQCREAIRVECEGQNSGDADPDNPDQTTPSGDEGNTPTPPAYQESPLPVLASAGGNVSLRGGQKTTISLYSTNFNLSYDTDQDGAANLDEVLNPPSKLADPTVFPGNGQNTIKWTIPATNSHGVTYNLYWSSSLETGRSEWTKIEKISSPYVHTGITNGIVYYYILTAVNDGGESQDSSIVTAKPLDTYWNWEQKISGTTYSLNDIAYHTGIFVAVGEYGTVATSSDGNTWTANQPFPVTASLLAVNYCVGNFVAVGINGIIIVSPDGLTWTMKQLGEGYTLHDIACSDNLIVAVGNQGTILTSADGLTWTLQNSGISISLYGVTYGNGKYVAVGSDSNKVYTSTEGTSWTAEQHGLNSYLSNIIYAKGMFIAAGYLGAIITSEDGLTWQSRNSGTSSDLSALVFGDDTLWAIGAGGAVSGSPDGTNWRPDFFWGGGNYLNGGVYGNGLFVLVESSGIILSSTMRVDVNFNILNVP